MKTAHELAKEYFENYPIRDDIEKLMRVYGEEVLKQCVTVINECRQDGETDLRSVRSRIESIVLL